MGGTYVSPSSGLGGLVHLNAGDLEKRSIQSLAVSVGLGVAEQIKKVLRGLDGPAGLGDTELLA